MKHLDPSRLSRREFLGQAAAVAAAAGLPASAGAAKQSESSEVLKLAERVPTRTRPPAEARVVIVRDARVQDAAGRTNAQVLRKMLERALLTLSGAKTVAEAWRKYFRKDDFVAMKYNELGGMALTTSPPLRFMVSEALRTHVGVGAGKVVPIGRCTRYRGAYRGWGDEQTIHTCGFKTRFGAVFDKHATAIVNLPVVKTHQSAGVTCALKIHVGSVKNSFMFCGDEDWPRLWKNLPELNSLPTIRRKQRLVIADALRPLYDKGPTDSPPHRFRYGGLIVSTDPVAVDAAATRIINDARRRKRRPPLTWPGRMLALAEALGVGLADPAKTKVIEIDLQKDA